MDATAAAGSEPGPQTGHDAGSRLWPELIAGLRAAGAAFALVFGSRARGTATSNSDLDVAAWWIGAAPAPWELDLPAGVDLVVLNDAPLELEGTTRSCGTCGR